MTDPDAETLHIEAAVFRRLREHLLGARPDVQNWKARHQREATPGQLAAFERSRRG